MHASHRHCEVVKPGRLRDRRTGVLDEDRKHSADRESADAMLQGIT